MTSLIVTRRTFLAATGIAAASFPVSSLPSTPNLPGVKRGVLNAIELFSGQYGFEIDTRSLILRIRFSRYSPERVDPDVLKRTDLHAFSTATDLLEIENLLPGFITGNSQSDFSDARDFFIHEHWNSLSKDELEIKKRNIEILSKILDKRNKSGHPITHRSAKYVYETVAELLERLEEERVDLISLVSSSTTPAFAGRDILRRAFTVGPEFLKQSIWFRLYEHRGTLTDSLSALRLATPNGTKLRVIEDEMDKNTMHIESMNGIRAHKKPENKCTALSVISPVKSLSSKIEESCKDENIELVVIKEEGDTIGFLYSSSKGIIEFIGPEVVKKIGNKQNNEKIVISFETGSSNEFIEQKLTDLYY